MILSNKHIAIINNLSYFLKKSGGGGVLLKCCSNFWVSEVGRPGFVVTSDLYGTKMVQLRIYYFKVILGLHTW